MRKTFSKYPPLPLVQARRQLVSEGAATSHCRPKAASGCSSQSHHCPKEGTPSPDQPERPRALPEEDYLYYSNSEDSSTKRQHNKAGFRQPNYQKIVEVLEMNVCCCGVTGRATNSSILYETTLSTYIVHQSV
jgi:hypothetical protein